MFQILAISSEAIRFQIAQQYFCRCTLKRRSINQHFFSQPTREKAFRRLAFLPFRLLISYLSGSYSFNHIALRHLAFHLFQSFFIQPSIVYPSQQLVIYTVSLLYGYLSGQLAFYVLSLLFIQPSIQLDLYTMLDCFCEILKRKVGASYHPVWMSQS